jgi:hypothetical protein
MAIKAGQILHVANQFVVDRIQTGGPGDLNIPTEKVFELGNYQSVGIVRDVPDLSFTLECLDVDTEVEALLTGSTDPAADAASTKYELVKNVPLDIVSPWKTPYGDFTAVRGVAIPNLALESASYRYGLTENAGETFTLTGDSIYYIPGHPWQDIATGNGTQTAFPFEHGPALLYKEGGKEFYALSVSVDGQRLSRVALADLPARATAGDTTVYADQAAAAGVTFAVAPETGSTISIVYGSADDGVYPQTGNTPYGSSTHQGVAVKPAAIRGKDIDVYFSTAIPGVDLGAGVGAPVEVRWPDVQSATLDWRVTLEEDREFGNASVVSRDATDVPAVTGSIELRPRSVEAFFTRLRQLTGVAADQVIGPNSSVAGALRIELRNPESGGATGVAAGTVLKTHYVPDARFTIPGYSGAVQSKLNVTVNFESDTGVLETFKGVRA